MSMHDVETFGETMVRLVGDAEISNDEKVSLIYHAYRLQDQWDVGFTRFRVYDVLVDTGFFHFFEMEEHPDYERYKDYFEGIRKSGEMWVYDDPDREPSVDNKVNSYWFDTVYDNVLEKDVPMGKMCCEPGMRMWRHFKGNDGFKDMSDYEVLHRLGQLAADTEENYAKSEIFHYLMGYLLWEGPSDENDLKYLEELGAMLLNDDVMNEYHTYHGGSDKEDYNEGAGPLYLKWQSYYADWRDRNPDKKGLWEPSDLMKEWNLYDASIHSGDIESAYRYSAVLREELDFDAKIVPNLYLFDKVAGSEYHEKTITRDLEGIADPDYREFIEKYREWYSNKGNVRYYITESYEMISSKRYYDGMMMAQRGLTLSPDNTYLKMYRAYCILFEPVRERIPEQIGIIEGLMGRMPVEYDAYLRYLLSVALHMSGDDKRSKKEMAKAVELDGNYAEQYEYYFGKK